MNNSPTQPILKLEQINLFTRLKTSAKSHQLGHPILQNITFEVFPGDRLGIVGINGSGKTCLFRVINRLTTASSGKISFKNREYPQIPVISLRKQIALVSPESKLLGMTVGEALAYPLILRGLAPQMIQERVTYWREQLEIPEQWLTKTEVQLSGGERQLVAIARSLVIQPEILLLDEPTTCLDPGRAAHLMQILIQLSQTQSTAILMINHQLDLVQEFCTGLLYLHQGTLLLNQATSNIDWVTLKVNLLKKATQAEAEWI